MQEALAEFKELKQIKENVRRNINALECCWNCQRISECEQGLGESAAAVWLCTGCRRKLLTCRPGRTGASWQHSA